MWVSGVATRPSSDFDLHWSLGIVAILGIVGLEDADSLAVDGPDNLICRPVDRICAEVVVGARRTVKRATVVAGHRLPFSKIVALYLVIVAAQPLPVDFVKAV